MLQMTVDEMGGHGPQGKTKTMDDGQLTAEDVWPQAGG
jgi:hypothetical protein